VLAADASDDTRGMAACCCGCGVVVRVAACTQGSSAGQAGVEGRCHARGTRADSQTVVAAAAAVRCVCRGRCAARAAACCVTQVQ
jgi:hypothetical protein